MARSKSSSAPDWSFLLRCNRTETCPHSSIRNQRGSTAAVTWLIGLWRVPGRDSIADPIRGSMALLPALRSLPPAITWRMRTATTWEMRRLRIHRAASYPGAVAGLAGQASLLSPGPRLPPRAGPGPPEIGADINASMRCGGGYASRPGTRKPFPPSRTVSLQPGTSVVTIGRAIAIASSVESGVPSRYDGNTNTPRYSIVPSPTHRQTSSGDMPPGFGQTAPRA